MEPIQEFSIRTQLLSSGRSHSVVAATDDISVAMKCYATGGENSLHRHPNEDHVFVVLAGEATFVDGDGVVRKVGAHHGLLVPKTSLYKFESSGDTPLVMLRIGAAAVAASTYRLDELGNEIPPRSAANRYEPGVPIEGAYYPASLSDARTAAT